MEILNKFHVDNRNNPSGQLEGTFVVLANNHAVNMSAKTADSQDCQKNYHKTCYYDSILSARVKTTGTHTQ